MARMHSRRKGKSGSTRPMEKKKASWISYGEKEIEMLIIKLTKKGQTPSQIGLHLRDIYGIPDVKSIIGKSITDLLKEKNISSKIPEDLLYLIKKAVILRVHIDENKQDETSKRGLQLTESKIFRLIKYYKKTGRLAKDWKYDPRKSGLYV